MTKKECILDALSNDDEARTQIIEYFNVFDEPITENELDLLLVEMMCEGLIVINHGWKNEHGEYPYSMTPKGKLVWDKIKWDE